MNTCTSLSLRVYVRALACRLHLDRDETWKQELMNWCNAYTAYTKEYNRWLCMKVGTGEGGVGWGWDDQKYHFTLCSSGAPFNGNCLIS